MKPVQIFLQKTEIFFVRSKKRLHGSCARLEVKCRNSSLKIIFNMARPLSVDTRQQIYHALFEVFFSVQIFLRTVDAEKNFEP